MICGMSRVRMGRMIKQMKKYKAMMKRSNGVKMMKRRVLGLKMHESYIILHLIKKSNNLQVN
jgi:hypothetical protein